MDALSLKSMFASFRKYDFKDTQTDIFYDTGPMLYHVVWLYRMQQKISVFTAKTFVFSFYPLQCYCQAQESRTKKS